MIEVKKNSKVFVAAPAGYATGGPELLHQLVYHLRNDLGIDAYMFYYPENHPNPVHPAYSNYGNPYTKRIEDSHENIIIVPEIKEGLSLLGKYKKIRKVVWWLSVDNFLLSYLSNKVYDLLTRKIRYKIFLIEKVSKEYVSEILDRNFEKCLDINYIEQHILKDVNYHLCQSYYAADFLKRINIDEKSVSYLSDYLNKDFLCKKVDISQKENLVAYNPQKGEKFTKNIISFATDIQFVPIVNMTREEVINTLEKVKVYIDFGNHPGKDRIPREAAILGCCVITGKKGSAKYREDLPIPDSYKFEDDENSIPDIVAKIKDCFVNFEERYKDFENYRQFIKNEPAKFLSDLKNVFVRV